MEQQRLDALETEENLAKLLRANAAIPAAPKFTGRGGGGGGGGGSSYIPREPRHQPRTQPQARAPIQKAFPIANQ